MMLQRRLSAALIAVWILAGCDTTASPTISLAQSHAAVASPSPIASTDPTIEPTLPPSLSPEPSERTCPTDDVLTVRQFNDAPRRCFGGEDVRILGWLDSVNGLEGIGPGIEPSWLAYPQSGRTCNEPEPECFYAATLWVSVPPELGPCSEEAPHCSLIFPHVPPGSDLDLLPLQRWVILTGHTNDLAAERCHWVSDIQQDLPPDRLARSRCREEFVVTAVEAAK